MEGAQTLLPAGAATEAKISSVGSFQSARTKYPASSGVAVYAAGRIEYADKMGVARITAFLRELDHSNHRFHIIDNGDYEYQD